MSVDVAAPHRRVTLAELRAHRDEIVGIGRRYGVDNIRVFGSVARDEADSDSDLDLLVDLEPGRGYFDLTGFALDVEQVMNVFTQVATVGGLKERMRSRIIAEAIAL